MKINFLKGDLVKNTRSGEVGVLIGEDVSCVNQNTDGTIYYQVLSKNGSISRWFKNHITSVEVEDEGTHRASRKYLA